MTCIRCGIPLNVAFMVKSKGWWFWPFDPVCSICVTPRERERHAIERDCRGCGQRMMFAEVRRHHWYRPRPEPLCRFVCSDQCYQRDRPQASASGEAADVHRLPGHVHAQARRDAKFCSGPCRQWTYRRRKGTAISPATVEYENEHFPMDLGNDDDPSRKRAGQPNNRRI
jgi:hypothetical protein